MIKFLMGVLVGGVLFTFFLFEDVRLEWISDPVEIQERFDKFKDGHKLGPERMVTGVAERRGSSCTIWAAMPEDENDTDALDTLGHEVLHCYVGSFHD